MVKADATKAALPTASSGSSTDPLLVASSLVKRYGETVAVNGLNLAVMPGEIYGLLGPNGSGKSTTLRMLTGILTPTSGTVKVCGHGIQEEPERAKASLGYVPDEPVLYDKLSALEFLDFVGELYSIPRAIRRARADSLLHTLDLEGRAADPIQSYSRGMKQKVSVAAALLHNPRILVMDEPITGLDPIAVRVLKGVLRKMTRDGAAVLMSTHLLEVAEHLCDRIGILVGGVLVAEGTMAQLASRASQTEIASQAGITGMTLEDIFISLAAGEEYKDIIASLERDEGEPWTSEGAERP